MDRQPRKSHHLVSHGLPFWPWWQIQNLQTMMVLSDNQAWTKHLQRLLSLQTQLHSPLGRTEQFKVYIKRESKQSNPMVKTISLQRILLKSWEVVMQFASKFIKEKKLTYYSGSRCFLWLYEAVTKLSNQLHTFCHFYTSLTITCWKF